MFRFIRRFLTNLILALLAAALSVGCVIYLLPDLQRTLLMHFLERDQQRSFQLEHVQLSYRSLEMHGLFVLEGLNGIQMEQMELELNPLQCLWRRGLVVNRGHVEGLFIDLSQLGSGENLEIREFLQQAESAGRARWLEGQTQRLLSHLVQRGFTYEINDLKLDGQLLMEDFMLEFVVRLVQADPDSIELEILEFSLY